MTRRCVGLPTLRFPPPLWRPVVVFVMACASYFPSLMCAQVEELERFIDAPLHVLYMKQLSLLREKALKTFKSALTAEGGEFEAMMVADDFFRREAEEVGAAACRLGPT